MKMDKRAKGCNSIKIVEGQAVGQKDRRIEITTIYPSKIKKQKYTEFYSTENSKKN